MNKKLLIALTLCLAVVGCRTTEEVAKKDKVEQVLNRVITETKVKEVVVEKFVPLPAKLVAPCEITHAYNRSVAEYVRVAIENTANAEACAKKVDGIRKLQP